MISREVVEEYGGVRELLERRRNIERVQAAYERYLRRGGGSGGASWPRAVKVPGEDRYTFMPRGTNCPGGAAEQHEAWEREAYLRYMAENDALISHADELIHEVRNATDRAILIDYYCNGMTDQEIARLQNMDRSTVGDHRNGAIRDLDEKYHVSPHIATR